MKNLWRTDLLFNKAMRMKKKWYKSKIMKKKLEEMSIMRMKKSIKWKKIKFTKKFLI